MGVSQKWGQTAWLSVSHRAPCVQSLSMCGTWQGSAPVCGCAMLRVWVDTWVVSTHHWWTPGVFHPLASGACAAADTASGFVWLVFLCLLGVRTPAGGRVAGLSGLRG